MHTRLLIAGLVTLAAAPADLSAQSYRDFVLVRDRPLAYSSVLEAKAGLLGSYTADGDPARSLDSKLGWDGYVYYHTDSFTDREADLDLYAGRDGAYVGVTEGDIIGHGTESRLELTTRYFPFYRQGFYNDNDFVPTGQYRGLDYGVMLSLARAAGEGLRIEGGAFFLRRTFRRTDQTASNYVVPGDYNSWGFRTFIEHNTLTLDRVTTRPDAGFVATAMIEWEQNDSSDVFGTVGVFEGSLPKTVWRGLGHLEWYLPASDATTVGIHLDAQVADDKDRVYIYDAQKPLGQLWFDGALSFRIDLGDALWITPLAKGQYLKILNRDGQFSDSKLFWGGGLDAGFDLGETFSIVANYSYLTNQSREPVSVREDTFAEQRFFVGMEARFGGVRK